MSDSDVSHCPHRGYRADGAPALQRRDDEQAVAAVIFAALPRTGVTGSTAWAQAADDGHRSGGAAATRTGSGEGRIGLLRLLRLAGPAGLARCDGRDHRGDGR
jgi:hypothetical protein